MIEITKEKAEQIRESFYSGKGKIESIDMSYEHGSIYMNVSRIGIGVTEYRVVDDYTELLNIVKEIYQEGYTCGIKDEKTFDSYVQDIVKFFKDKKNDTRNS